MKLAEALLLRSDQQKKLASLKQRINTNVLVQEGDEPSEDPKELIQQAFQLSQELQKLIGQIHYTNAIAKLSDDRLMLDVLRQRDDLIEKHKILIQAIENSDQRNRYSAREIKWTTLIPVASLQRQADDISVKIRDLNIQIQAANWQIDLIEI